MTDIPQIGTQFQPDNVVETTVEKLNARRQAHGTVDGTKIILSAENKEDGTGVWELVSRAGSSVGTMRSSMVLIGKERAYEEFERLVEKYDLDEIEP